MADFVAVLRKTIGALSDNSPEMRERVYEKARATIEAKLAAINPPPPAVVVERQMKALEDAIGVVRAEYDAPPPDTKGDDLDSVLDSLDMLSAAKPQQAAPAVPAPEPASSLRHEPVLAEPDEPAPNEPHAIGRPEPTFSEKPEAAEARDGATEPALEPVEVGSPASEKEAVAAAIASRNTAARRPGRRSGGRGGLAAALVVLLLVVSAGGYAVWTNRDDFSRLLGLAPAGETASDDSAAEEIVGTQEAEPDSSPQQEDVAALAPAPEEAERAVQPPAAAPDGTVLPAAEDPQKFTQRLLPDGREVDEGPAGGPRTIGEGTSVASVAQAGAATDAQAETAPAQGTSTAPAASAAVAVGQRAIFYEERTNQADASAEPGSIVWSMVQESPGGDMPPEPAIRAEATIPGKDVQLRMTIRRNGDRTLPASHIVEMIFLTPDGFEGGSISNVSRISFKQTEQDAGNPLIGIPAKIADGFFLIALSDAPAEVEVNTSLLRIQRWLDIPIVYQSGRRALLSMEKGIPGERVFEDVLRAWAEASG